MKLIQRYSRFFRDVATLASGRGASMVIKLALTPFIARLFSPSDFGVLAFFGSLVAMASAFATLRYDRAIVLAPDEGEAGRLAQLTYAVIGITTVLITAVALVALLLEIDAEPFVRLSFWVLALPASLAFMGIIQVLEGVLSRRGKFAPVAYADIGQVTLTSVSRLALGALSGSSVWALFVSYLLGVFSRVAMLAKSVGKTIPRLRETDRATLLTTAKAYRDFPLHNAPTAFLRDFSDNMPVFALSFIFSPAVAGYYAMANRVVWAPVNTASTALRRVLTQRLAKYRVAGWGLLRPTLLITAGMAVVGVLPFGLLWIYAVPITPWLLGDQWVQAGEYIAVLTPLFFVGWLTRPSGTIYVVLRRQSLGMWIQTGVVLARVAVFAQAYLTGASVIDALQWFVYVSIAGNAVIFTVGMWLAHSHDKAPREPIAL